jgi:hypothetical protein
MTDNLEKEKTTFVDLIRSFVDDYLTAAGKARGCEKNRLSIIMYLSVQEPHTLMNLLYLDNVTKINEITIKQVVSGPLSWFHSRIEKTIIKGFQRYAEETKFVVSELKLKLAYKEGVLVYKAFYQGKPIAVDLETFFAKD